MNTEDIIKKLDEAPKIILRTTNASIDLRTIFQKIEELTDIEAHGKKQVLALESLEKLIWYAAKLYYNDKE